MKHLVSVLRFALVACAAIGLAAPAVHADDPAPPNWRATATGSTRPAGDGTDLDDFGGNSSVLGRFTGAGFHVLYPDLTFAGEATWTAADGSTLSVEYAGGPLYLTGDPDYPFGFEAVLVVTGGTGRLAGASGTAVMTGAFTGTFPGELYFEVEGTLHPQGK